MKAPLLTGRARSGVAFWQSAAQSVRQKERSLKELEPGGASHVSRPFVDKKKFSFRFPPCPRCAPEVIDRPEQPPVLVRLDDVMTSSHGLSLMNAPQSTQT